MSKAKQTSGVANKKNVDLPDSPQDKRELQSDDAVINLPDVKDIPGQEHVHPPDLKEFADTTISSADEEADYLWDEDSEEGGSNVSPQERKLIDLSENDMPDTDDQQLRNAQLDNVDSEGEPLNERSTSVGGSDLDVPGANDDDSDEEIGEEDEENNPYSLGGDENSVNEERNDG